MESPQHTALEMERKYLITDEATFKNLFALLHSCFSAPTGENRIADYDVKGFYTLKRPYRYFDTFEGVLTPEQILICAGPLERTGISVSVRSRDEKEDYGFTVKFPTADPEARDEHHFPVPANTDFNKLNPNDLSSMWEPLQRARKVGSYMPLQEIIRQEVETNRFNLYHDNQEKVEVALDEVLGRFPGAIGLQTKFYELEVEVRGAGTVDDKEKVSAFFSERYGAKLVRSSLPKYKKTLKLIRGEKILPD